VRSEATFPPDRAAGIVVRTRQLFARRLWLWPLLAAVLIGAVGVWARHRIYEAIRTELAAHLRMVLNGNVAALKFWFQEQQYDAKALAADVRIQGAIQELVSAAKPPAGAAVQVDPLPASTLQLYLRPLLESQGYTDFVVVGKDGRILASLSQTLVGQTAPGVYTPFLRKALAGELTVCPPFPAEVPLPGASGDLPAGTPTMFVAAPVWNSSHEVIAVLALRMDPWKDFSQIFSVAQGGRTADGYAFNGSGLMLTPGRFEAELRSLGLIPDRDDATAVLNLRLRDPGRDLHTGSRSSQPRQELRLTRAASEATAGQSGSDVRGYRDYRGVVVVGAWTWLPDYEMGVVIEVAFDEAYRPVYILRQAFLTLFGLLVLSGAGLFVFSVVVERLQAAAQKSARVARRLGQYTLEQEIGVGANGTVYRGRHALLRRPVAIKLLKPDKATEANLARFEHEVQATSQLTHPNTVAIYDYGRTPDGIFYYAMEYLSGISLERLVDTFGPQPEGRVIHILRQVCGSLDEAHALGLIHRDIKPANIILTRRGGLCDVAKVLDFGLVKALGPSRLIDATVTEHPVGTPRYMSPEAIKKPDSVDARSDLYSLGAVGYLLLTGQPLFENDSLTDLLASQVRTRPMKPSARLGRAISADLEGLVLQCLDKERDRRPASARVVEERLAACVAETWTAADATRWWQTHRARLEPPPAAPAREKTLLIAPRP
jgi:hypothetical protein